MKSFKKHISRVLTTALSLGLLVPSISASDKSSHISENSKSKNYPSQKANHKNMKNIDPETPTSWIEKHPSINLLLPVGTIVALLIKSNPSHSNNTDNNTDRIQHPPEHRSPATVPRGSEGSHLGDAARDNNVDAINILLERGASTEICSSALKVAIDNQSIDATRLILQYMLRQSQNDIQSDDIKKKAFGYAASRYSNDRSGVIDMLLREFSCNQHCLNEALIYAIAYADNRNGVLLLLNRGANINYQTQNGWTALMVAARHNSIDAINILLERGASTEIRSSVIGSHQTALECAICNQNIEATRLILQFMLGQSQNDSQRNTVSIAAFGYAARCYSNDGHSVMDMLLREFPPNQHCLNEALLQAASYVNREGILLLLNQGANINYQGRYGRTALMNAMRFHGLAQPAIELLIEHGADASLRDIEGNTAAILSVTRLSHRDSFSAFRYLLDHNAVSSEEKQRILNSDDVTRLPPDILQRLRDEG